MVGCAKTGVTIPRLRRPAWQVQSLSSFSPRPAFVFAGPFCVLSARAVNLSNCSNSAVLATGISILPGAGIWVVVSTLYMVQAGSQSGGPAKPQTERPHFAITHTVGGQPDESKPRHARARESKQC